MSYRCTVPRKINTSVVPPPPNCSKTAVSPMDPPEGLQWMCLKAEWRVLWALLLMPKHKLAEAFPPETIKHNEPPLMLPGDEDGQNDLREEKWGKCLMTALWCLGHCKTPNITKDLINSIIWGCVEHRTCWLHWIQWSEFHSQPPNPIFVESFCPPRRIGKGEVGVLRKVWGVAPRRGVKEVLT